MTEENKNPEETTPVEEAVGSDPQITPQRNEQGSEPEAGSTAAAETPSEGEAEMEKLRAELEKVRSQVAKLEHERFLLGRGVPEEDLDYYAFKIEQQAGASEDFAKAAKEYLRAHPVKRTAVSSGAELGAGGSRKPASSSDLMNQLLRNC